MRRGAGVRLAILLIVLCLTLVPRLMAADSASSKPAASAYDTIAGDLPEVVVAGDIPYYVAGDIYIPPGKTVRIEPGAVFLFKNFTGLQIQGKLLAHGTEQMPIVFTSENDRIYNRHDSPEAAPFDWNGVFIHIDAIGTDLERCRVLFSVEGLVAETRFIRLASCVFRSNGRSNVSIEGVVHDVGEEPYTYEISLKGGSLDGVPLSVLRDPAATRRNVLRYSGIALAVGGAALGVVFSNNYAESSRTFASLSSTDPNNLSSNSSADWDAARNDTRRDRGLMLAGWAVMVAGGIGLTVSFTF